MEHEQRTINEASSSAGAYCSTLEELDATSFCDYTSAVEDADMLPAGQYWTTVNLRSTSLDASDSDNESFVRVLPGAKVRKFEMEELKLLERIGEGGQGIIYNVQLTSTSVDKVKHGPLVAKQYKGRRFGQWPEAVFEMHKSNPFICRFYGYCLEGESFYLIMKKYDYSLRDVLDKQTRQDKFKGRPLDTTITLTMIIEIALGMWFLHENNIIHRDLKADNVFVKTNARGSPTSAYIGDFDVASNVVGTLYWRAPEVLQALKNEKDPLFTPEADVYSFAMTCYEILTGSVPLKGVRASNYDAVLLRCERPNLPSNLNPKLKDFLNTCWHQDPRKRPTFKEIVLELKELHRELIIGSEYISKGLDSIFSAGRSMLDVVGAGPEDSLLELKALLQALLMKYNHADFLVLCVEIVAHIEQYQSEFGLQSFKEHPSLPFSKSFAREKLSDSIVWKSKVFSRLAANIVELKKIWELLITIIEHINEGRAPHPSLPDDQYDMVSILALKAAYIEEYQARVLPDYQHKVCSEIPAQACDLCKREPPVNDFQKAECRLYVDSGFAFPQLISGFFS